MLNFANLQQVTKRMNEVSFAYTENFWQKIFDNLNFDEENISLAGKDFGGKNGFPEDADPKELFFVFSFTVNYSCLGDITIYFEDDMYSHTECASELFLFEEVLRKNGFTEVENEHTFVYKV